MIPIRFTYVCALVLLVAGCGGNQPVTAGVTCGPDGSVTSPDVAASTDVAATVDSASDPDVAAPQDASTVSDIVPAADQVAAQDSSDASDHPPPTDALASYDGLLADGPLPPGITLGGDTIPHPTLNVSLSFGLLADLRASTGLALYPTVHIADVVHVTQGYVGDIVYLKYGRLGPPPGIVLQPGVNYPFVVSFGGARVYSEDPKLPPHPESVPAFALFDAMTKVPETSGADGRVRQSPNGRIRCNVPREFDGAFCVFTGVMNASMTYPPQYVPGVDGGSSVD